MNWPNSTLIPKLLLGLLLLNSCGIKTTIPATDSNGSPSLAEAVAIESYSQDGDSITVTCNVNQDLLDYTETLPVFIEFQGAVIQTIILSAGDSNTVVFDAFTANSSGTLFCGVEYLEEQFVSDQEYIQID